MDGAKAADISRLTTSLQEVTEAWVRLLKSSVLLGIVFGGASFLLADTINDPLVSFSQGGSKSPAFGGPTDPSCNPVSVTSCIITIPNAIGSNGFATGIEILNATNQAGGPGNPATNKDIVEIDFFIPTENFDQTFSAFSNLFLFANILLEPFNDQIDVEFGTHGSVAKSVPGVGNGSPGTDTVPGTGSCTGTCLPGFTPDATITVEAFFGTSSPKFTRPGLLPGHEGTLNLLPSIPEPASLVLLISAVGLIAGGRKLRSRRS